MHWISRCLQQHQVSAHYKRLSRPYVPSHSVLLRAQSDVRPRGLWAALKKLNTSTTQPATVTLGTALWLMINDLEANDYRPDQQQNAVNFVTSFECFLLGLQQKTEKGTKCSVMFSIIQGPYLIWQMSCHFLPYEVCWLSYAVSLHTAWIILHPKLPDVRTRIASWRFLGFVLFVPLVR